ncbi:hypothetical protein SAMN05216436_1179 [bacterium A37T11]|nr:hypothetical protein SAMN05216436_1179 [bacterium A37T11]
MHKDYDLIHLSFKNLFLNFSFVEYSEFRMLTKHILGEECTTSFPDGSEKFIIRTPFEGVNFSLDAIEMQQLANLLDEAHFMKELYVMNHPN